MKDSPRESRRKEGEGRTDSLWQDRKAYRMDLTECRDIFDHLPVGICMVGPGMEIVNANRQMHQWYPQLQIKHKPICYRILTDDTREHPCPGCPLVHTLRDGLIHEAVMSCCDGKQSLRHYRMITSPVYDGDGKIKAAVNIMRDITEQIQMENKVRESEKMYRTIFELTDTPAGVLGESGTLVMVNHEFEQLTGYVKREIEGRRKWTDFFPPDDVPHIEAFRRERMANAGGRMKAYETRLLTENNETIKVLMNMLCIPGTPHSLVSFTDITVKRSGYAGLNEEERQFREMVQNANSIIYRRTPEGIIQFINRYAQNFFGYAEEEIVGKNVIGTIVPPVDSSGRDLAKMIHDITFSPQHYIWNENENMLRNGERVWITWANKVIYDEYGKEKEVLCVGQDVTERRKMELALKTSEEESRKKAQVLRETNVAMKVLLRKMKKEREEIEQNLTLNVQDLIRPQLERLQRSGLKEDQTEIIGEIVSNLNGIASSFLSSVQAHCRYAGMTPMEMEIANLIREGKSTKEIEQFLKITRSAVNFHRANIRKKLGLTGRKWNLTAYLLSLG